MSIFELLNFVSFTIKFQQIKRSVFANGEDRHENDAEHSFQLALVAWYIIDTKKLGLDVDKVLKYALIHDLVETYAGDVDHYAGKEIREQKKKNEKLAFQKIKNDFPDFHEMIDFINEYENKANKEARFIYALDKMITPMNIYLDKGRSWFHSNVTLDMVKTKQEKITISKEIESIWNELVKVLETVEEQYFPKSN